MCCICSTTKELLPATYVTKERGTITVKGKGEMLTYWLESKANRSPPQKDEVRNESESFEKILSLMRYSHKLLRYLPSWKK